MMKKTRLLALVLCLCLAFLGCGEPAPAPEAPVQGGDAAKTFYPDVRTAIMLPGIEGENPIFQMYVAGLNRACTELGAPAPKVVEGGDDWNSYGKYLISLAESGLYDVLFTCTDVMRYHVADVHERFPDQKLVILDADMDGYRSLLPNGEIPENVYGISFDKYEQGYLGGMFCALVTKSAMPRANSELVVGLVFTDLYDPWDIDVKTGFTNGVRDVDPEIVILNSIIGDWVDPQKGADVTRALFAQGADIVYYTTGASAYGCVTEAAAQGKYAVSSDNNAISLDPETIAGCTLIAGEEIAYKLATESITGTLAYGVCEHVGADMGVVSFTFDDPVYLENVPADIQEKMRAAYQGLIDGTIDPHRPID